MHKYIKNIFPLSFMLPTIQVKSFTVLFCKDFIYSGTNLKFSNWRMLSNFYETFDQNKTKTDNISYVLLELLVTKLQLRYHKFDNSQVLEKKTLINKHALGSSKQLNFLNFLTQTIASDMGNSRKD